MNEKTRSSPPADFQSSSQFGPDSHFSPDSVFGMTQPAPLHECVVLLARFLGTPVQLERLRDALAAQERTNAGPLGREALQPMLSHAGLVASPLSRKRKRRPSELPALVVATDGRALALLSMDGDKLECALPGIEGSTWLTQDEIDKDLPAARWWAIRPQLHFDQRSLLYTLPQAGRWFWDTFDRSRWIFAWALIGTLVVNIFGALIPFYAMAVYDRVIPNNALSSLWVLTSAALLLIGFEFVMRVLRSHLLESAARRMDVALSSKVFAQCLRMRADGRPASGGVLANTVRDFESIRDFFTTGTLTVLGDVPFMLLYIAVIALVGGWLVAVPLVCIPLLLLIAAWARPRLAKKVNEGMQESSQRTAHLFETMNGLDTVKSLGAEAWSRRKWEGLTQVIAHNQLETREISAKVQYANAAVMGLASVAVVAIGAVMMVDHGLTLGQIIAVSMLVSRALQPASQIAGLVVRWEQTKLSYDALNKVMAAAVDESVSAVQAPPLTGKLEFRDVSFAYPKQPPALQRVSFTINPGERVGVIGRLGSGKSTLLRLILNQYSPTTGSVLVDELVNTHIEPLSLRRQIGYVPQDVTLFHGTIRENIELGRVSPGDRPLIEAVQTACLDEVVATLPGGMGTPVGERGERLSGGQRQLVAISRALLTKPRLLLLDEPSSMVDPGTEQKLIARLRALPHTTIVLVTHRTAMLALIDRLIVMDQGRVVADGPRDKVLQALAEQRPTEVKA